MLMQNVLLITVAFLAVFGLVVVLLIIQATRSLVVLFRHQPTVPEWDPKLSGPSGSTAHLLGLLAEMHAFAFGETSYLPRGTEAAFLGDGGAELVALKVRLPEGLCAVLFKGITVSPRHAERDLRWPGEIECIQVSSLHRSSRAVVDFRQEPWLMGRRGPGNVHRGIHRFYLLLRQALLPHIMHEDTLFLCGHSFGGAQALMVAHELSDRVAVCVTAGAPRCGDEAWATAHPAAAATLSLRNDADMIPALPLAHMPALFSVAAGLHTYCHVGEPKLFSAPGQNQVSAHALLTYQRHSPP